MDTHKQSALSQWRRWRETLITTAIAWMPLKPGLVLRQVLYRFVLGKLGSGAQIQPNVEFVNPSQIEIGKGVKIDRYVRLRNVGRCSCIRIGNWVRLNRGADLKVHSGGQGCFEVGDYSSIGPGSHITGLNVKIGKYCLIAPQVGLFANNHVFDDPTRPIMDQGHTYKGIVIEDDCWLGCGVKVMDGVTIGKGSVIGAGAVVTKDIPPYSIAVGIPARVIGKRGEQQHEAALLGAVPVLSNVHL